MAECDVCKIIENKESFNVLYEDEVAFAILHEMPAQLGHVIVFPKKHYPIFEEVPEKVIDHLFNISNKLSSVIFDSMGYQGTNIIVNNGVSAGQELPHFIINIIPRKDNDNLNFEWTGTKKADSELDITQTIIKQAINSPKEKNPNMQVNLTGEEEPESLFKEVSESDKKETKAQDYRLHRLRRIP